MNENNQPPNGQQPPYNPQQPNGQQPPYNTQQQPYGQQPPYNTQQPPYGQQPPYNAQQQPPYNPQQPPYYAGPLTDNTRLYSILSYLGFLWIVGLIADRNNPRVRYHVNQGIILFILECTFKVVTSILDGIFNFAYTGTMFHAFFPISIIDSAMGLVILVLMIIGIVHAAQDREEPLPIIGTLFTIVK